jgi:hypothetical protein
MNAIQTMKGSKRQYIKPAIYLIEIGSMALLTGSDAVEVKPSGSGDAGKAMIGAFNSPWPTCDTEDDEI